jgi:hypothetical protein
LTRNATNGDDMGSNVTILPTKDHSQFASPLAALVSTKSSSQVVKAGPAPLWQQQVDSHQGSYLKMVSRCFFILSLHVVRVYTGCRHKPLYTDLVNFLLLTWLLHIEPSYESVSSPAGSLYTALNILSRNVAVKCVNVKKFYY